MFPAGGSSAQPAGLCGSRGWVRDPTRASGGPVNLVHASRPVAADALCDCKHSRAAHAGRSGCGLCACQKYERAASILKRTLPELAPAGAKALQLLSQHPEFKRVGAEGLRDLIRHGWERVFRRGEHLMRQGDECGNVFVILSGQVSVEHHIAGAAPLTVATLGAGELVGEVSAVVEAPHQNTVTARTDLQALEIPRQLVRELMGRDESICQAILGMVQRRTQTGPRRSWG